MPWAWPQDWFFTRRHRRCDRLVLFFVCAVYTHILATDYGSQFGLAIAFLALNVTTLVLGLVSA